MEEINKNILRRSVLSDLSVEIEADHVRRVECRSHFEALFEALFLGRFHVFFGHMQLEVYSSVRVMLLIILVVRYVFNMWLAGITLIEEGTLSVPVVISSIISLKGCVQVRMGSSVISITLSSIFSMMPLDLYLSCSIRSIEP